jgi:hypothetical protein
MKKRLFVSILILYALLFVILGGAILYISIEKNKINSLNIENQITEEDSLTGEVVNAPFYMDGEGENERKVESRKDIFWKINNTHWSHMPLSYSINQGCGETRIGKIKYALEEIELSSYGKVSFEQSSKNADIEFVCYKNYSMADIKKMNKVASSKRIMDGNEVVNATITFYDGESCGYYPFIEIHEVLHTFGFKDNENISSVMYENTEMCKFRYENEEILGKPSIDEDISQNLIETYSI